LAIERARVLRHNGLANSLSDLGILAISALAFGFIGGSIAYASSRLWFRRWPQHSPYEDKLADAAHTSLLGFSAFVLALLITEGFTDLSKAEEAANAEATAVYRLGRELDALGPAAPSTREAKQDLAAYAENVAKDEWPRLASLPTSLSPVVQKNLDDLWTDVRAVQRSMDPRDPVRGDLATYVARIETLRDGRLAAATTSIPKIFWVILVLFVIEASFLSGRETPKRFGMQINIIHMSAIGLAVGLVIILSNPYRGETSISPDIIRNALGP
jgi:Protein of unknown function (DUF4239)